jgi:hypothetical protein
MPRDLNAIAAANSHARRAQARQAVQRDASGRLAAFHAIAGTSVFGTNVDYAKVLDFADAGELLDGRRIHMRRSGNAAQGLRAFAAVQRGILVRREAFEDLWQNGRRFLYGALNIGGAGVEAFGPVCIVVADPEDPAPDALAVFPGDTAHRYADRAGAVNAGLATQEATSWRDRAELAVVVHEADVPKVPDAAWAAVVCSDGGYIEIVRAGALPLRAVAEARLRTSLRQRLDDIHGRWVIGDPSLTQVERNEAAAYDVLLEWRRDHGTAVVDVG